MPYTSNPHLPKLRMRTVMLVRSGWSIRAAARHVGVEPSTVSRWVKIAPLDGRENIPTLSSARHTHPNALDPGIVKRIVELRLKLNRCSEVIHRHLILEGIKVSLRSVKRTLDRHNLLKKQSPFKRLYLNIPRPYIVKPGDLVQVDTIHLGPKTEPNFFVYTLLDVFSRWAYALVSPRISTHRSLRFVRAAQDVFPDKFQMLQSDNGPEFSKYFSLNIQINHRHSRVRKPNDNAHLERFNRTIQDECFSRLPFNPKAYQKALPDYLEYYNSQRLHLGLQLKTPNSVLRRI
jgi:transposase InsO family protein